MAYTFRIHKGSSAQEDGWQKSEELVKGSDSKTGIASIDDSIEGGNAGKIGTSIPTPFARIYLFDTAFSFVATTRQQHDYNFYDQLVTQSLDLLQLLFEKGADPKLKLYEWNGDAQVTALNEQGFKEGHKTLAVALNTAIKSNPRLGHITLIEYDGVLLGGTSPMTVVYTSPNAIRQLEEKNVELLANDKSPLFKARNIKHLKDRAQSFQRYVAWLLDKYNRDFTGDDTSLVSFYNYADRQFQLQDIERSALSKTVNEDDFKEIRRRSSTSAAQISANVVGEIVLRYNDEPMDMSRSDFLMRPSIHCYGDARTPAVIPTDGDSSYDGWRFTDNERWQSLTTVDYFTIMNVKPVERYLPTVGVHNHLTTNRYPWLTTGDFFEDNIVDLGFDLNTDKFYFPVINKGKSQFLLPVRREYFKYFTLEDLKSNLRAEVSEESKAGEVMAITVELKVPLQNREYLTLRRNYIRPKGNESLPFKIISYSRGSSLGIFPFYRCPLSEDGKNEYSIYLYGFGDPSTARLDFYRQDEASRQLIRITDSDTAGRGEGVLRTFSNDLGFSRIYNLRNETTNSFDVIEIMLSDGKQESRALVVPMWIVPPVVNTNKETIISVDFGTSNTYVSYLEDATAHPLTIGMDDQQMVLLNKFSVAPGTTKRLFRNREDFGKAEYMHSFLREFVPSSIGDPGIIDKDEYIEYPIKTATLEKQNFGAEGKLFSDINIGFNIDNEKSSVDSDLFRYVTDLKWSAEEHKGKQEMGEFNKDKCRVRAFCDQTLWMMKNKLIMKGFSTDIKMVYFYPDSMSDTGREIFRASWNESVDSIFRQRGFTVTVKEELEAISPYYSLLVLNGSIYSKSTANIDIGGGTTDYFILDQKHMSLDTTSGAEDGKAYEASVFFAGNDLWGAAYPQSLSPGEHQKNGFVSYMKTKVPDCSEAAQVLFKSFDSKKSMADYSGFFFKNNNLFNFSDLIANQEKFRFVVFLHYAAIIYHFTDMLKKIKVRDENFTYPQVLTFTGKGSEYVWMIAGQEAQLAQVTMDLIRAFGIPDFSGLQIIRVKNPKALTADGGIYEMMSDSSLRINLFDSNEYGAVKSNTKTNTPYDRIGKECIGLDMANVSVKDILKPEVEEMAKANFAKFADIVFFSQDLAKTRNFLKFNLSKDDYNVFVQLAQESYRQHAKRFMQNHLSAADSSLQESVFFFSLKNALINLSVYYFENIKN